MAPLENYSKSSGVQGWVQIKYRFFNDQEVCAIWDEENSKGRFSVLDISGVLNEQDNYEKKRNY